MLRKSRFILVLVAALFGLSLMSSTYSRYVAETPGSIEASFAQWQILVNETDITTETTSNIDFVPVIDANENVKENVIAPSSSGYFNIAVDPTNVDVSFNYSIELAIQNSNVPDITLTGYSIYDSTYIEGEELTILTITDNTITNDLLIDNEQENFMFDTFTVRVYFEWAEGEGETMTDADDTLIGLSAAEVGETFSLTANLAFEQIL